jgi:N-acyl-D-aspartate/D-glutamate deacylase
MTTSRIQQVLTLCLFAVFGRGQLGAQQLAVRSASGLPPDILGMTDCGYLRENLVADLVVFDPKHLEDRATYEKPLETSAGIRWFW